ncbi:kinase-like domain-containing protein [Sphaerosporella brunnea]|uniref:non-specific serine/threonine protein kinase n=1 Tax=Sphaerosporella brunnea TaxID=1250544 RepID=A0A5J5ECN7_9PEZI|nr:kinase-like domain-containing protein [Sphaerosporella brunnea]
MSESDCSDTASDNRVDGFECDWVVENPTMYRPGGFHPVAIGDELHDGRYRVIHRLSHGAYGTVWMALDQRPVSTAGTRIRYVAVKIGTASYNTTEATIIRQLHNRPMSELFCSLNLADRETQQDVRGLIITVLDEFDIHGPNGTHHCLVTELLGPSVSAVRDRTDIGGWGVLPPSIARPVAVQCAEAVVLLHSQGIVHADLHTGNMLFALTVDIHEWSVEEVYAALGHPREIPMHEALQNGWDIMAPHDPVSAHQPQCLVYPPAVSRLWALCCSSPPTIRIIDFTESFPEPWAAAAAAENRHLPGTPRSVAAPELLLNLSTKVTKAIDVWALGCVIFELVSQGHPFRRGPGPLADYLASIMLGLGGENNVPEAFREAFRASGAMRAAKNPWRDDRDWNEKFAELREITENPLSKEDEQLLCKVIASAFVIEPGDRASAAEILALLRQAWPEMFNRRTA